MPYILPNFNLTVNVWHSPNVPPAAPDLSPVANLCFGRRVGATIGVSGFAEMQLLLPAFTDLRWSVHNIAASDIIEVPAGSGRFYQLLCCDDMGKGFPNEHRYAILQQTHAHGYWPIPVP